MNYVGMDIHKKYSVLCALNEAGQELRRARVESKAGLGLEQFFQGLDGPSKVLMEACWNWGLMHDRQLGCDRKIRFIPGCSV